MGAHRVHAHDAVEHLECTITSMLTIGIADAVHSRSALLPENI